MSVLFEGELKRVAKDKTILVLQVHPVLLPVGDLLSGREMLVELKMVEMRSPIAKNSDYLLEL